MKTILAMPFHVVGFFFGLIGLFFLGFYKFFDWFATLIEGQ